MVLKKVFDRLTAHLWWVGYLFSGRLFQAIRETRGTSAPISWRIFWQQKVRGVNRAASWPVSPLSIVGSADKIKIGIGSAPGLGPGCYIQGNSGIEFGAYVLVAPRVSVISANHDLYDIFQHVPASPIRIGDYSWLGVGSTVLPGVELGPHTIVAAGAVVTKSFPEGYCVLAGVPARCVKILDRNKVVEHKNRYEYIGYHKVKCSK